MHYYYLEMVLGDGEDGWWKAGQRVEGLSVIGYRLSVSHCGRRTLFH
ncbi:MAG: hypothetical protein OXU51_17790 [Candidatus Poribacteria bacterium]|nr:hypothetical protein [Candidatus Poribacteria bacterium]